MDHRYCTIAAVVTVGAGLYWEIGIASALVIGICAVFLLLNIDECFGGVGTAESQELAKLEPAQACLLGESIAACEVDARTDAYRLKVVEQGREFVAGEVLAFRVWKDGKGSRHWAAVHSLRPIEADPIPTGLSRRPLEHPPSNCRQTLALLGDTADGPGLGTLEQLVGELRSA